MENLIITDEIRHFYSSILKCIDTDYKIMKLIEKSIQVNNRDSFVGFSFGFQSVIISHRNYSNEIKSIDEFDYSVMIPESLLFYFQNHLDCLPFRLKRWVHKDFFSFIREELINDLHFKRLSVSYDLELDEFVWDWKLNNVKLVMNKRFIFEKLE